ncbi:hypothetical protein ALIPUT_01620 [Alistipes putredinis DSM 17216]|uniref:Uncharacterized protein n=1 Tax=Alistipes putredinis DSM 17216 TaxID=445970 RepID=B0MWW5_9BACT|nr:hypothetical protein ALIPUT_01620 [Alistipes putredinis DSM 17216]
MYENNSNCGVRFMLLWIMIHRHGALIAFESASAIYSKAVAMIEIE